MEIGALSTSLAAAPRVAEGVRERTSRTVRDPAETPEGQAAARNSAADSTSQAEAARKEVRETREAQQAHAVAVSSSPRIQFKDSEGTRVMEVYDSKNILIYQVPPKGLLMLIHSQEHEPQVETSA